MVTVKLNLGEVPPPLTEEQLAELSAVSAQDIEYAKAMVAKWEREGGIKPGTLSKFLEALEVDNANTSA